MPKKCLKSLSVIEEVDGLILGYIAPTGKRAAKYSQFTASATQKIYTLQ